MSSAPDRGDSKLPADAPEGASFPVAMAGSTTRQKITMGAVLVAVFAVGFGLSELVGGFRHLQTIETLQSDLKQVKRRLILADAAAAKASDELKAANARLGEISQTTTEQIERVDHQARAFREKSAFVMKYAGYLKNPEPGGAAFMAFVDHICALSTAPQPDVLTIDGQNFDMRTLRLKRFPPDLAATLEKAGITSELLDDYNDAYTVTKVNRNVFRKPDSPEMIRLAELERQIKDRLANMTSVQTATFFDSSAFEIPAPISEHLREGCAT